MLGYGVHGVIGVNSCFCCDLGQHGLSKVGTQVATVVVSRNLTILLYYITYLPDSHSQAAGEEMRGGEKWEGGEGIRHFR